MIPALYVTKTVMQKARVLKYMMWTQELVLIKLILNVYRGG